MSQTPDTDPSSFFIFFFNLFIYLFFYKIWKIIFTIKKLDLKQNSETQFPSCECQIQPNEILDF